MSRLSLVAKRRSGADRIYVLKHGSVSESGSHEELIKRQGVYADLFERQARSYR